MDFTLDSIRETYTFDGSCQGSVSQAVAAFLESEEFEDAIRNIISIGGDCDTTGAITGSIAWIYYAVQSGAYEGWVTDLLRPC
ncbi:MAG TPA: ADP-ribosylglycohydrolase family protein [Candidatus Egerieimonas intestinavium]|uniref:ADP-ribosylglycohydrolase family protein n=1 Tax=Candidatus Egerieimonas intestinavium TaxID=2840777 RepID=A0A9D1EH67_9FIRM|nr:ADP-ribosylglycohydrolase family protein [Candidatus Egerieimonas intestinavium]